MHSHVLTPLDCVFVCYVPQEKAKQLVLGSWAAEIGIVSFIDNRESQTFEREAFKKKFPMKSRICGRPRKIKDCKFHARFA